MSADARFGLLRVDKPCGPTSHDVVEWVRRGLRTKKVGHCGTLDPAAAGLLVICVGAATRLVEHFTGDDKTYEAEFGLGIRTSTGDAEGEILERVGVSAAALEAGIDVVRGLSGRLLLPPPIYSAIHVDGRRAHELARAGAIETLEPRPMTVHSVTAVETAGHPGAPREDWDLPRVRATLCVSKGTYVRSLAEELGRRLALPAHLVSLRRTHCGSLAVAGAVAPDAHQDASGRWRVSDPGSESAIALEGRLTDPLDSIPLPVVRVDAGGEGAAAVLRLASGQRLGLESEPGRAIAPPQPADRWVVVARGVDGGQCVIVRTESGDAGRGPRIQPERVLSLPPDA